MRGLDCQAGLWLQGKGRGHVCSKKYRMYNGMLSAIKKNKIICGNMDGPRDSHAESSKSGKNKYMIFLTCGILKKATNELPTKPKQSCRCRK